MNPPRPAWIADHINGATGALLRKIALATLATAALAGAFALALSKAEAAPAIVTCNQQGCSDWHGAARPQRQATPDRKRHQSRQIVDANGNGIVLGGRPAGCPHRFCGCEASLFLFGRIIPDLNLAANWIRKFPRTSPAPRMAAARSGHVFILISHVEGADWLVHDGNSGGGQTREHVRSISGFVIVNPSSRVGALQ
jgi:hypothetical protein